MNKKYDEVSTLLYSPETANIQKFDRSSRNFRKESRIISGLFGSSKSEATKLELELGGILKNLMTKSESKYGVRKIKANHRSITGWVTGNPKTDPVQFESTLERDFAYLALFDDRVTQIQAQPFTLKYESLKGKNAQYTPDYLIEYQLSPSHPTTAIVEVKYTSDLESNADLYRDRFAAMENWCQKNDHEFHIVTENDIRSTHIENVRALFPRRFETDLDNVKTSEIFDLIISPVAIGSFLNQHAKTNAERAQIQKCVWSLVAGQMLHVDLSEPLTINTIISRDPQNTISTLFFSNKEPVSK